ncbi:MAG: phenylalanine--tRNA ligase subunit beta, partial [Gammaproteobacteria bacterium]
MKISEQWLREWVNPPLDIHQLAEQLTMAGLEVESVASRDLEFSSVNVARIEAVTAHPDSDKLRVCVVDDGGDKKTVVSAAGNLRIGMH